MDQIYSENRIFFKETELTHHQKYKLELHKLLNLSRSRPRSRSMAHLFLCCARRKRRRFGIKSKCSANS